MTFERFKAAYRDDEADARFTGRRYDSRAPAWRGYRFAACGPCLEGDAKPYLRTPWLIERCSGCRASLRVAPFTTAASFSPATCTRCGRSLLDGRYTPAHPSVARMQAALFRGKCEGITELEGLGRLSWEDMVALADVLLGMVWTDLTLFEQEEIFLSYTSDPLTKPTAEDASYDCRHGSLQFLSWLTEGWPDSPGAKVGQSMLIRWLTSDRNRVCRHLRPPSEDPWSAAPNNFESPIRERLRALADAP